MKKSILAFSFLIGWWTAIPSWCQRYLGRVDNFNVEHGLSSRFVNQILQDSKGFLWLATNYGLNRYDGHEFRLFTSQTLPCRSDFVTLLAEDDERRLWIATRDRAQSANDLLLDVFLLDTRTLKSIVWQEAFPGAPVRPEQIFQFQSKNGQMFLITREGRLYRYAKGKFNLLFEAPAFSEARIWLTSQNTVVLKSRGNDRYAGSWDFAELDENGRLLCRRQLDFFWNYLDTDTAGFHWLLSTEIGSRSQPGFIYTFRKADDPLQFRSPARLKLPANLDTAQGSVLRFDPILNAYWYIGGKKAFVFDWEHGLLCDFTPGLMGNSITITPTNTSCIGNGRRFWVADPNPGHGFFQLTLRKSLFDNHLADFQTRSLTETGDGRIRVETQQGTILLDEKSGKILNWLHDGEGGLCVIRDRQGQFWSTGFQPYLACRPQAAARAQQWRIPDSLYSAPWALYESPASGRIWLGCEKGLLWFDPALGEFHRFSDSGAFPSLQKQRVAFFLEEKPGLVRLATSNGVFLLDEEKGLLEWHSRDAPGQNFLPARFVNHIYKDADGIYWLATRGEGLVRWDGANNRAEFFKIEQGLSHNVLYAVHEDRHGGLWLPSDRGIMHFDKNTRQVRTFLLRDGIPHEEFNTNSHYRASDGRLWFGGLRGITVFDPEDFYRQNDADPAALHLTQFQQFDAVRGAMTDRTAELARTGKIVLQPGDKTFLLKFSLLDYEPEASSLFAYKIEGLDDDWIYLKENALRVVGLPAGQYRLLVKAQGANGLWSAEPLALKVLVKTPFYRQSWFLALVSLLLSGAIWWRFRAIRQTKENLERTVAERTGQIERDKQIIEGQATELRELDQLKSRFFANVSHELRTPLTLILGPLAKLLQSPVPAAETREHLAVMQRNGQNLLRLVEEILDLSKLDAGRLELSEQPVVLLPLLRRIMAAFQSHAEIRDIRFEFRFDEDPALRVLLDAAKFERIATNLLSNAFKFTPRGGQITVLLQNVEDGQGHSESDSLALRVSDTGRGIAAEDLPHVFDRFFQTKRSDLPMEGGTGIGLALSREYAQLFGGRLEVESEPGTGSVFSFIFPKKIAPPETVFAVSRPEMDSDATESRTLPLFAAENAKLQARLLLVEDNADMQKFLREALSPFGNISIANNGQEALEQLRNTGKDLPDLIVTDLMMPEMDGLGLLKNLRAEDGWRHIPAVMLTARAGKEERLSALRLGVDDYLTKPFDPDELQARVRNLLQRQQRRRDLPFEPVSSADDHWLKEMEEKSLAALERGLLSVTFLADDMALSERQFRRKIEQLTGMSPNGYLREVRLQKARYLLENRAVSTVSEVAYRVGFNKVDYFSQLYLARFGKLPSGYR